MEAKTKELEPFREAIASEETAAHTVRTQATLLTERMQGAAKEQETLLKLKAELSSNLADAEATIASCDKVLGVAALTCGVGAAADSALLVRSGGVSWPNAHEAAGQGVGGGCAAGGCRQGRPAGCSRPVRRAQASLCGFGVPFPAVR